MNKYQNIVNKRISCAFSIHDTKEKKHHILVNPEHAPIDCMSDKYGCYCVIGTGNSEDDAWFAASYSTNCLDKDEHKWTVLPKLIRTSKGIMLRIDDDVILKRINPNSTEQY